MALVRRILTLLAITTLTNAADDTAVTPHVAGPSDVWLGYCDKLMSIDAGAFPKLRMVAGDVWLLFSPDLASVAGSFPALARVDGFVHVHGLDSLQTLDGVFPTLEAAGGVQISDSSALTSLDNGFPRLAAVSGHLAIFGLFTPVRKSNRRNTKAPRTCDSHAGPRSRRRVASLLLRQ